LILDGITGLTIKGRSVEELCEAMMVLMDQPARSKMRQMARTFAETNRVDEPFTAILDSEAHRRRVQERESGPHNPLQLSLLDVIFEDTLYDGTIPA
jgi:hypothetical protein